MQDFTREFDESRIKIIPNDDQCNQSSQKSLSEKFFTKRPLKTKKKKIFLFPFHFSNFKPQIFNRFYYKKDKPLVEIM